MAQGCELCPVGCGADRAAGEGCGGLKIAKAMLHRWEEPVISGRKGSGAIFFAGCNLGCVFCQNAKVSRLRPSYGTADEAAESQALERAMLEFDRTADNINLITAAHVLPQVVRVLKRVKPRLHVPVVYNSGGYERAAALKALQGLADVYLPDIKFFSPELSQKYCGKSDYFEAAAQAVAAMLAAQPEIVIEDGLIKRGVIIRHLVLPGSRADSIRIVEEIARRYKGSLLSLMSQYTPEFNASHYKELDRRVTGFEYQSVLARARELGLSGFFQTGGAASSEFTPDF